MRYCILSYAGGAIVLLAAELSGVPALRLLAVALLLAGGIGAGLSAAWRDPDAAGLSRLGVVFPKTVFGVLAGVLAAPVVVVLVESLIRAIDRAVGHGGPVGDATPWMGGVVVGLLMLVLAIGALVIGIRAVGRTPRASAGTEPE